MLVFGGHEKERLSKLTEILAGLELEESENNADLIFIEPEDEKKSIGIGQVRGALKFLNEKPLNHSSKAVVVKRAHILTDQAQNALLKTLEEHPTYANIILCSKTENDLLPTVISRCRRLIVGSARADEGTYATINDVVDLDLGGRLAWVAEELPEEKEQAIEMLKSWVGKLRGELNIQNAKRIEIILSIIKDLENTNVATKLALENLVLKL